MFCQLKYWCQYDIIIYRKEVREVEEKRSKKAMGLNQTEYIKELHNENKKLIIENERLKLEVERLKAELEASKRK